jgi:hypothetical protein
MRSYAERQQALSKVVVSSIPLVNCFTSDLTRPTFNFWTLSMNQLQFLRHQGLYYDQPIEMHRTPVSIPGFISSYQFCLKVDHQVLLFAGSSGHICHSIDAPARL